MESRGLFSSGHRTKQRVSSRSLSVRPALLVSRCSPTLVLGLAPTCHRPQPFCSLRTSFVLMASLSYDVEHYMPCPGPIVDGLATGHCGAIIPKVIVCTGPNREKRCQRVSFSFFIFTLRTYQGLTRTSAMFALTSCGFPSKTTTVLHHQVRKGLGTTLLGLNHHRSRPCDLGIMVPSPIIAPCPPSPLTPLLFKLVSLVPNRLCLRFLTR